MTTFEDRERGYEAHFALDQEQEFKAQARRDRMLGLWAAERLGLKGDAADNYALSVMRADLKEPGDEDVFRKIRKDLDAKGVAQSDEQIRLAMIELMEKAIAEVKITG